MAGETLVTVVGNLTADPELRHTASGMTPFPASTCVCALRRMAEVDAR